MDELKTCPFCGSTPIGTWEKYLSGSEFYLRCNNGDCLGASFQDADPEKVIAAWNHRTEEQPK